MELDPKIVWALRNPAYFPVDPNRADYPVLLRVPGIGVTSARRIIFARKHSRLDDAQLAKLGVVMKRAKFFLKLNKRNPESIDTSGPATVRAKLIAAKQGIIPQQLSLFALEDSAPQGSYHASIRI